MNLENIKEILNELIGVRVSFERIIDKINFESLEVDSYNYRISSVDFEVKVYNAIKEELNVIYQEKLKEVKKRQFVTQFYEKFLSLAGHNEVEKANRIEDYNKETSDLYLKLEKLDRFIGLIEHNINGKIQAKQ